MVSMMDAPGAGPGRRMRPMDKRVGFRDMMAYVRPQAVALTVGGVLSLATGASGLILPLVVRALVTDLSNHRGISTLVVIMCVLVVLDAVTGAIGTYVLLRAAETIVLRTRERVVDRLLRITIGALDRSEPGDLMARAAVDTTLLRNATSGALVGAITGTLTLVAALVLMGTVDVVLLGVALVALALAMVMIGFVAPRIGGATRTAQQSIGIMAAALERMLGAFRTVKASGAEHREGVRVKAAAVQAWQAYLRAGRWQAIVTSASQLSVQAAFLAVLATGGAQVASGSISVGTLVAFLLYIFYLIAPMQQLLNAVTQYQVGAAAAFRIQEVQQLPAEPSDTGEIVREGTGEGPTFVEFNNVRFRYRPELPEVHHGVSFVIPTGGMTAFVGPSGAGKTSVFSLIERFYEPDSGEVLIDGLDTREWSLNRLRAAISYVEQDAPVLSGSLRENLLLGAPDATEDEVTEVLRTTRLTDMIGRLPDGLDTPVGHRGTLLSGGERQRVAIARALLRRPRLLLLDEATSQLDAINEASLRETVADVAKSITVLVVAHRLSTVTMADRIIVMDAGRVLAMGTHTDLVAMSPLYAELAATQFLVSTN